MDRCLDGLDQARDRIKTAFEMTTEPPELPLLLMVGVLP